MANNINIDQLAAEIAKGLADPDVTIAPEDKAAYEADLAATFVGW